MEKTLLIAKNDIEGVASSILLNTIFLRNPDMNFYKYETPEKQFNVTNGEYESIFVIGLKNANSLKSKAKDVTIFNSFNEVVEFCKFINSSAFTVNNTLKDFCEHITAYLDWTWKDKNLYYGKNIDELIKYYNKPKVVTMIADRIINKKEIVTDTEKEIIVFAKKLLTSYIENKNYSIIEFKGKKFACTYSDINEIELSNKLLKDSDIDVVVIINLNNNIVRFKSNKVSEMKNIKDKIIENNGFTNCNGGTLKLEDKHCNSFHNIFLEIIKTLEGGSNNG